MDETMQRGLEPRRSRALPSPDSVDLKHTALLLDVDGTLLDIAATPEGVVVPASLRATLAELLVQSGGGVALVSGRTVGTLDRLFAPLELPAIGAHGAEMRIARERPVMKHHPPSLSDRLRDRLHGLSAIDPRLLVEDKLHSIAVHYRLAPRQEAFLKKAIADIVMAEPACQVEILPGKAVIEIKSKRFNKGTAVRSLMSYPPFSNRTPIFIGDDTTDEAVFAVLPELSGVGFSVEGPMKGADGIVPSPEHVRAWLARLSTQAGSAP
jgi:trehalose 6-phosphate phosphatase